MYSLRFLAVIASSSLIATASGFVPIAAPTRSASVATTLASVPNPIDTFTSGIASICRLPNGITVRPESSNSNSNIKLLRLYDIENSRACRTVRELLTELDLVVDLVVPAASNSRAKTDASYEYAMPQGASAPCLVVSNGAQEETLTGSEAICNYLKTKFGIQEDSYAAEDTKQQVLDVLNNVGSYVAGVFRIGRGAQVSPAASALAPRPKLPLVLYSYESNQFCRLVREVLTELDLPYELRNAGKQSPRRTELAELTGGSTQCPYLIDPNTDTKMAESVDIVRYLYKQYALWTPPNELLQWASQTILPLAKPVFAVLAPAQAGSWRKNDPEAYEMEIERAMAEIEADTKANPVLVYTYGLSPFSSECKALLDSLNISYTEVSLGQEWLPGLIKEGGAAKRAALLKMTGQSSLPHIFIGGKSIGGLYSGSPGLLPALEAGVLRNMVQEATTKSVLA
ncbi:hypothetical protein MPSEU_000222000 [Mayamaea pseudoterrestris]|nr:hypothetical protein MPSEU_000222000 [Mayamaea pseudoterrestris]